MKNLVSGMILVEKEHGDLHYYVCTPIGHRIIDTSGFCEEFDVNNYSKAYIPESYDDCWTPLEGTVIDLTE